MKISMKQFLLTAVAICGMAYSSSAQVSSNNAAGYIKVTINAGQFAFLQIPFNKFDGGDYKISDILGTSLPAGSIVFTWNDVAQRYDQSNFIGGLNIWNPDPVVTRGTGFFVQASTSGASPSYDVFLYGEVPGATSNASTSLPIGNGFNAIGFPYPVSTTIENSGLTAVTAPGDIAFLWNGSQYVQVNRIAIPSVPWSPANTVIDPGAGIFIFRNGASLGDFLSSAPYSYPNN